MIVERPAAAHAFRLSSFFTGFSFLRAPGISFIHSARLEWEAWWWNWTVVQESHRCEKDCCRGEIVEFSEWRVSFNSLRAKLVVVYRPPYSEAHPITPRVFLEEFGSYLETIIISPESLILTGDYDFHVDVEDDPDARAFLDLLASMGLKQHVNVPTHVSGHTLDLMITREHDLVISCVPVPTDISRTTHLFCVLLTAQILIVLQRLFVIVNSGQLVLMLYARMWKNPNFAQGNTVTLMS